jgi:hypothetical protein
VIDVTSIFGQSNVSLIRRKDKFISRADRAFIDAVLSYRGGAGSDGPTISLDAENKSARRSPLTGEHERC